MDTTGDDNPPEPGSDPSPGARRVDAPVTSSEPGPTPANETTRLAIEDSLRTTGSSGAITGGDWPAKATDTIVDAIGAVRDKTTGPITTAARAVVFGVFLVMIAITVLVLVLIGVVRLADEALPSGVWLAYLGLGAAFLLAGALVFRRRRAPGPP